MNPLVRLVLNAVLKYLETHPDQIEALVVALLDFLIRELQKAVAPKV